MIGICPICPLDDKVATSNEVVWDTLRRHNPASIRPARPSQFYPIYISEETKTIVKIGEPITPDVDRLSVPSIEGCVTVFPVKDNGVEMMWGVVPEECRRRLEGGFIKIGKYNPKKPQQFPLQMLSLGTINDIKTGKVQVVGHRYDGSVIAVHPDGKKVLPKTQWDKELHDARYFGSEMLEGIIGKRFSFPKSLYAVHDCLKLFVANKPNALIVDFFAGSGTTLHAVNLLNKEDGGNRRCIMVTNNEISAEEEEAFKAKGLHKGDEKWEKYGIARYVNWPRTKCSILGIDVNDKPLEGDYISSNTDEVVQKRTIKQLSLDLPEGKESEKLKKQILQMVGKKSNTEVLFNVDEIDDFMENIDDATDTIYVVTANNKAFKDAKEALSELPEITKSVPQKIPMCDGFKANAAFFKLGFLDKKSIDHGKQLQELMPVLWMKAGAHGVCPTYVEESDLIVLPENKMALLIDEYEYDELLRQLAEHLETETVYIVNDNEEEYYRLAQGVKVKHTYQLYRDYLDNFKINIAKK